MSENFDETKQQWRCSFCGRPQSQVRHLVAGPGIFICDECVEMCLGMIEKAERDGEAPTEHDHGDLPKPKEIFEVLSDYVIGHQPAKKTLAVAV